MKRHVRTVRILIGLILFSLPSHSQYHPDNGFLDVHFGKPITFYSRDSTFSLGISGRIQGMAETRHDIDQETGNTDFYIRRMRLNFAGNALGPKFSYRIQLGFSQRDVSSNNSAVQNNLFLRDAMLYYAPNKNWRFGFGQTKVPGNRQRQVSSANLQFADRSNTNSLFTLDRDKGFWISNTIRTKKKLIVGTTVAITSGEGRITSDRTNGLCYSIRSDILPFGDFTNNGDYVEADLFREEKLKLSIGFVYSYNDRTSRETGQLGEYLLNGKLASFHYYGTDVMLKNKGWSFIGELYRRSSKDGVSMDPQNPSKVIFVYSGTGFLAQTGYLFTKKDEFALRYGFTSPDEKINTYISRETEYMMAYSHYFFRHNLKLQTDVGYFKIASQKLLQWRFTAIVTF